MSARWSPWFALFWWWSFVTAPLTWAIAAHGVKVARLAEARALRPGGMGLLDYLATRRRLDARIRVIEFIQSLPVRLEGAP